MIHDSDKDLDVLQTPSGGLYRKIVLSAKESNAMTAQVPPDERQAKRLEIIQWLQLIGIVIAVAGIFMAIGRRDQTLEDLKTIVNRLVESDMHMRERMSNIEGLLRHDSKP